MSTCEPEKCISRCPLAKQLAARIDKNNAQLDDLIRSSINDIPEKTADSLFAAMAEFHLDYDPDTAPYVARGIRRLNGEKYRSLSQHTSELLEVRDSMIAHCAGPIGMRAALDDAEYAIWICPSTVRPFGM